MARYEMIFVYKKHAVKCECLSRNILTFSVLNHVQ